MPLLFPKLYYAAARYENNRGFNIAPNPSFEEGTSLPASWTPINGNYCDNTGGTANAKTSWANDQASLGSKSLAIKDVNWTGPPQAIPGSWMSSEIPIDYPQVDYYVFSRIKMDASSKNLSAVIWFCAFDQNGSRINYGYKENFPNLILNDGNWYYESLQIIPNPKVSKITIGISASCYWYRSPCSGNFWIDDINMIPMTGRLSVHAYEDLDNNQIQSLTEKNLSGWIINLSTGFDCNSQNVWAQGVTDNLGNASPFNSTLAGTYSITLTQKSGWFFTTPKCRNLTLYPEANATVDFGLATTPSFPYLSQKDPAWGSLEYDHAISQGPFFCGKTIAGCGCAVTSSAMLLTYHGATKSPSGEDTTPKTLDDWLKNNSGYTYGALKWNSVAAYSVKANAFFGTQKIKFTGIGGANNHTKLNSELANSRPVILEEPNHFIVASGTSGSTYSIADPAWQNKTLLSAYGNTFSSMRMFEKTNTDLSAIYLSSPSPAEFFVINSNGQRAGKDPATGLVYTEILNSFYFYESVISDDSTEGNSGTQTVTTLVIINPAQAEYKIAVNNPLGNYPSNFSTYDESGDITSKDFNFLSDTQQEFELNYSPKDGEVPDITKIVDIDIKPESDPNVLNLKSNGVVPVAVLTTNDFDASEINTESVEFGPNKASPAHKLHIEDADSDIDQDAIMHFPLQDVGLGGNDAEICLKAETLSGLKVKGCDQILISPG